MLALSPGILLAQTAAGKRVTDTRAERGAAVIREIVEQPNYPNRWRTLPLLCAGTPETIRGANEGLRAIKLAGCFDGLTVGIAVRRFGDKLEPATLEHIKQQLATELSEQNGFPWPWTNHLQKATGWANVGHYAAFMGIVGGEILERPEIVAQGKALLRHLMANVNAAGDEGEHNSPGYTALSITCAAAIAELSQDPECRQLGRWHAERLLLMALSRYHQPTNQVTGPSGRTYAADHIGAGDGIGMLLNERIFPEGIFHDLVNGQIYHSGYPGFIQVQNLLLAWEIHPYLLHIARDKPLPYQVTSCFMDGGWNWRPEGLPIRYHTGGMRGTLSYLAPEYALVSQSGMYQHQYSGHYFTAYWPLSEPPTSLADFRILWPRYASDEKGPFGENTPAKKLFVTRQEVFAAIQHRNKAVVLQKPRELDGNPFTTDTLRMEVVMTAWRPVEELYAGEALIDQNNLPVTFPDVRPLFLRDGKIYACLQPLTITDLGRQYAMRVSLNEDHQLLVSYFHLKGTEKRFGPADLPHIRGGCALEIAPQDEYPDLAAFRKHIAEATLTDTLEEDEREVVYASGGNTLRLRYNVITEKDVIRQVNGQDLRYDPELYAEGKQPYVNSPCAIFTAGGKAALGESNLQWEPVAAPLWLLRDPTNGDYAVWNLSPQKVSLTWKTPGGDIQVQDFGAGRLWLQSGAEPRLRVEELPGEEATLTTAGFAGAIRIDRQHDYRPVPPQYPVGGTQ